MMIFVMQNKTFYLQIDIRKVVFLYIICLYTLDILGDVEI